MVMVCPPISLPALAIVCRSSRVMRPGVPIPPELMKNVPRSPCLSRSLAAVTLEIRPSSKVRVTTPGSFSGFTDVAFGVGTRLTPHPLESRTIANSVLSLRILESFRDVVDDLIQAGIG